MILSTQLVGSPVYPRPPDRPTPLRARVARDSAAGALYQRLLAARGWQQRQAAVDELIPTEELHLPKAFKEFYLPLYLPKAFGSIMLASWAFSAHRLEKALAILNNPGVIRLSAKIEKMAAILFESLLVGDISAVDLAHGGAISNEAMLILAREIPEVVQHLKIAELTDRELIIKLRDDPAFREEFTAARKNYRPPDGIESLREEFVADLVQLGALLAPLRGMTLFWSPRDRLREKINDEGIKRFLWDTIKPVIEVEKYLTHDIGHTFASGLVHGYIPAPESEGYHLARFLHGFCHLSSHLEHYKYVLAVNKYRLDGELPSMEDIPLAKAVETAAYAAGFRWRLPVSFSEEPKAGCINCFVEEGIGKVIHPAFLDIFIYNLIKNSIKAEIEAGREEGDIKITVTVKRDKEHLDAVIISVEDNAQGFDPTRLLRAAMDIINSPGNQLAVMGIPTLARIKRWKEKPFHVRTFSMGEILDLAFVAKISGFSDKSISSGLGLAEVAEVAQLLGADVMMTNKYSGGARVDLILGSMTERERIIARELGSPA